LKKRLSTNIKPYRFFFLAAAINLCYELVNEIYSGEVLLPSVIILPIFTIILLVLAYFIGKARTVEFDEQFMYVTGIDINEAILLSNIVTIKLTMTSFGNQSLWKIWYLDENKIKKSVRVLPFYKSFNEFKTLVKSKNQKVEIRNFSHTFDLDQ